MTLSTFSFDCNSDGNAYAALLSFRTALAVRNPYRRHPRVTLRTPLHIVNAALVITSGLGREGSAFRDTTNPHDQIPTPNG